MYYRIEVERGHAKVVDPTKFGEWEGSRPEWVGLFQGLVGLEEYLGMSWNWLPIIKYDAEDLKGLCWFTSKGWEKIVSDGLLAKVEEAFRKHGVPYRVRRKHGNCRPLYSEQYQAIFPRDVA